MCSYNSGTKIASENRERQTNEIIITRDWKESQWTVQQKWEELLFSIQNAPKGGEKKEEGVEMIGLRGVAGTTEKAIQRQGEIE